MNHYGEKLKDYIRNKGTPQKSVAEAIGVTQPGLTYWIQSEFPSLEGVYKITKHFGDPIWKPLVAESEVVLPNYMTPEHADVIKASTELPVELQVEFWANVTVLLGSMIKIAKITKQGK